MPTILAWRRVGKIGRCEHSGSWQVSAAWRFRLPDTKGVRVHIAEGPPVSIPNTEVKLCYADNTCLETDWEDRSMRTPGNQDRQHSIAVLFGLMRLTEISIFLLSSVGRRPRKTIENRFTMGGNQDKEKWSRGYRGVYFDYVLGSKHDCLSGENEAGKITSYISIFLLSSVGRAHDC